MERLGVVVASVEALVGCVRGDDTDRGVVFNEDFEGPSLEATKALLSQNFRYSYLPMRRGLRGASQNMRHRDVPRMYFSNSLSRDESSRSGGGGCLISFGLNIAFDLALPMFFMLCGWTEVRMKQRRLRDRKKPTSTCSLVHVSIVTLFLQTGIRV